MSRNIKPLGCVVAPIEHYRVPIPHGVQSVAFGPLCMSSQTLPFSGNLDLALLLVILMVGSRFATADPGPQRILLRIAAYTGLLVNMPHVPVSQMGSGRFSYCKTGNSASGNG